MNFSDITPVILTKNEEDNIARTLAALHWAERIVVLDSGSTDDTEWICRSNPRVEWHSRTFDTHAAQWNAGLALVQTPWILTLDADYLVTDKLAETIGNLPDDPDVSGFLIPFVYCIHGHPLRSSLLPPRIALFRKNQGQYRQDGHTQDLVLEGTCSRLSTPIWHDDRKPFRRWLRSQWRYAALEEAKLKSHPWRELSPQDRLRRLIFPAPFAVAIYCLFVKAVFWEGLEGWTYAFQRTLAESILSLALIRSLWRKKGGRGSD